MHYKTAVNLHHIYVIFNRYKKTTIYLDAKESDTIESIKKQIEGLLGHDIKAQKLYKNESQSEELSDSKALGNCGITGTTAMAYRFDPPLNTLIIIDLNNHLTFCSKSSMHFEFKLSFQIKKI